MDAIPAKRFLGFLFVAAWGVAIVGCTGGSGEVAARGGATPVDSVVDDLQRIVVLCNSPDNGLDEETKDRLIGNIAAAEEAFLSGETCEPVPFLDAFLAELQRLHDGTNPTYERLYNLGRAVLRRMVIEGGWNCTGHKRLLDDGAARAEDPVDLVESDAAGLTALFHFWEPSVQTVFAGPADGQIFTEVKIPGLELRRGEPGAPSIPSIKRLIAVPIDHVLEVDTIVPHLAETIQMNLYPAQEEPVDQAGQVGDGVPDATFFADRPFVIDEDIYATDRRYPAAPFDVAPLGFARDYQLFQLEVYGGQYNPVSRTLELFDTVNVEVDFVAESTEPPVFVTEASFSPFESGGDVFLGALLNKETVGGFPPAPQFPGDIIPANMGEEYLILTHPDFRDAADALAAWKNEKGILTNVFNAGAGVVGRATKEEIRAFLDFRYETSVVRPSYVLLLGDAEFIEPWYFVEQGGEPGDTIGSDWGYARKKPTNEIVFFTPQFALGRIPVDTPDEAMTVVNKIVDYEQNPPEDEDFYNDVSLAGQFQCCRTDVEADGTDQRTYIEVSEIVRHHLVTHGYNVQRIYTRTIDNGAPFADPPIPAYEGDPTPRFIYTGQALPADIGPDSGFSYFANTSKITSAFNSGRFLMLHRDHGSSTGWINPEFSTNDMGALFNGARLPVVYSINCTTGIFDNETSDQFDDSSVYFSEKLLRKSNGGAVGVIGDTRASPSWANSALTRGLFDATWPGLVPGFGPDKSFRRLGDILNHAKLYLWTQVGATGISVETVINEMYLWHVLGDPTMEIWTSDPHDTDLPLAFGAEQGEENIIVDYALDGATITALQETEAFSPEGVPIRASVPVGRAKVVGGRAVIEYFQTPVRGLPIQLSASFPNAVSVELQSP